MVNFMERKGYEAEAHYVSVVQNWRRAVDERSLSGKKTIAVQSPNATVHP